MKRRERSVNVKPPKTLKPKDAYTVKNKAIDKRLKTLEEIAKKTDIESFSSILGYLYDPDPVLRKKGIALQSYQDLLIDPHLKGELRIRVAQVTAMEWELKQNTPFGDVPQKEFDLISNYFAIIKDQIRATTKTLTKNGVFLGYQPTELQNWQILNGLSVPLALKPKPPRWFRMNDEGTLILRARTGDRELTDEEMERYITVVYEHDEDHPYGDRLAKYVFWPVTIKKGSWRFWVRFIEKYGMPWISATYDGELDDTEADKFLEKLKAGQRDAIIVSPTGSEITLVEASNSAASENYKMIQDKCDLEITKATLGLTHVSNISEVGARATSETQYKILRDNATDDALELPVPFFNKLIERIYEVNYADPDKQVKPEFVMKHKEGINMDKVNRDVALNAMLVQNGRKLADEYISRQHGIPLDQIEENENEGFI